MATVFCRVFELSGFIQEKDGMLKGNAILPGVRTPNLNKEGWDKMLKGNAILPVVRTKA